MDFRTAEQKAEFDSLFKSFLETFNKQFNQIRSIQIKINEQVKSIEVKNDKFFHEACARLSEPESPDRSSNSRSTPTSQTDIDDEKLLSSTGESEISQSTRDARDVMAQSIHSRMVSPFFLRFCHRASNMRR